MAAVSPQLVDAYRSRRAHKRLDSVVIASYLCILIVAALLATSDQFWHWFVLPVTLSGILIGIDVVDWARGRVEIFDPVGIFGVFGFHFFFLAPLLHIHWNYYPTLYTLSPPDWRPWLGAMALLNTFGLVIYRVSRERFFRRKRLDAPPVVWRIDRRNFFPVMGCALVVTFLLQLYVYASYGGILGYIHSYETQGDSFRGMGWLFTISESFPILALIGFAVYAEHRGTFKSWGVIALALVIYFMLQLLFGGLRGERSNTLFSLFWAVGILHFWLRPFSKKVLILGGILVVLFAYLYGFYKDAGLNGLQVVGDSQARSELTQQTGRGFNSTLLGDLGRSNIQAFLLYRLQAPGHDYEYAWGRTYAAATALFIPSSVWPDRPPLKDKEGTSLLYGMGTWNPVTWHAANVYGIAGEVILNFGPVAVPFTFLILAFLIAHVRRLLFLWYPVGDNRLLLYPMLVCLCIIVLISDFDNDLWNIVKFVAVPGAVLWFSSTKEQATQRRAAARGGPSHTFVGRREGRWPR